MESLRVVLESVQRVLDFSLFTLGNSSFTLRTLLYTLVLFALLFYVTAKLRTWTVERLLAKSTVELGVRHAIVSFIRYIILFIGVIVILQTAGINLSTLTVLTGALGIGVGFGLQSITNNFVSGLIILLERPIKVGDRVQVGDIMGGVVKISPRATTVVTNDNISIIVPNSEFISSSVTNWSHSDRNVRLRIPVGVAYSSDPEVVRALLVEVAGKHPGVLKKPPPDVIFLGFGDSSLDFELRVWTMEYITQPATLRSDLYFSMWNKLKEKNIEIPFPQRDLHIRSGVMNVKTLWQQEKPHDTTRGS